ncbi:MAG: dUTP diphosphatase [Synechococcales cyanobacterium RM1_1_8]|nr:dUTP diphosphatase [Synechococcales cyanobacterium RM1_1_8]
MQLPIQKLHPAAILPKYAHPGDAGLDLYALAGDRIEPGQTALVATGIAIALPPNTEAQIRPRSGLALKHSLTVLNSPGTVDAGYRGEIKIILINHGQTAFEIEPGMRIAQMVICPVIQAQVEAVESLDDSERGSGGFGSSGLGA